MKPFWLLLALLCVIVPLQAAPDIKTSRDAPLMARLEALVQANEFAQAQQLVEARLEAETNLTEQTNWQNIFADVHSGWAQHLELVDDHEGAIEHYQMAYATDKTLRPPNAALDLTGIGLAFVNLNQTDKALPLLYAALAILRETPERNMEAATLTSIGTAFQRKGQADKALEFLNQATTIFREVKNPQGEMAAFLGIGSAYRDLSQFDKALQAYNQALLLSQEQDPLSEAITLNNIGETHVYLSQYEKALKFYNRALSIVRDLKDRHSEAITLNNIGGAYYNLGQYEKALGFFNQSLPILEEFKDRRREATTLSNIGGGYEGLGQYEKALQFFKRVVPLLGEVNDPRQVAKTFSNIGLMYNSLNQPEEALQFFEMVLTIQKKIDDHQGEAVTLTNIGVAYRNLNQSQKAAQFYDKALLLSREVHDRSNEALTLSNLMVLYRDQKQPELAILDGKQSVNLKQSIRRDVQHLDKESQRAYLAANRGTYETLAALLIEQNRLEEAEQVLRLLRLEDAYEFARRDPQLATGLAALLKPLSFLPEEKKKLPAGSEVTVGEGAEESRLWQGALQECENGGAGRAALISTFNTDTTFYVLLATAKGRRAFSFPIAKTDFDALSARLQGELSHPRRDPREDAAHMESIVFCDGKLEKALGDEGITVALWFPSGSLRVIPIDALYDGQHYLVENARLNIEATLTSRLLLGAVSTPKVLAAGSSLSHSITVDDQPMRFPALPAVMEELRSIVSDAKHKGVGPFGGDIYADEEFGQQALEDATQKHENVLHLATHFYLHPGAEGGSFLLLGDGTTLPLSQWRTKFQLRGVELLTLSACDTDADENAGTEVSSLAEVSQWLGARSVIASHWSVADASTSLLMADFYSRWKRDPADGKAAALREAQRDLLRGLTDKQIKDQGLRRSPMREGERETFLTGTRANFSHPYYWAPFTLIGNWR